MRKGMLRGWLVTLFLTLGPTLGSPLAPPKGPKVSMSGTYSGDSVQLALRWTAVKDVRGTLVQEYRWLVRTSDNVQLAQGTKLGGVLADTVTVARPLPGDSVLVQGAVAGVDSRGFTSAYGVSGWLAVLGKPWVAPPPPTVQIDTVASRPPDSAWVAVVNADSVHMAPRHYYTTVGRNYLACMIVWRGGEMWAPRAPAHDWSKNDPYVSFVDSAGTCAIYKAVHPTDGSSGWLRSPLLRYALAFAKFRS